MALLIPQSQYSKYYITLIKSVSQFTLSQSFTLTNQIYHRQTQDSILKIYISVSI